VRRKERADKGALFSPHPFRLALPGLSASLQQLRDRSDERIERRLLSGYALRLFVGELALAFAEEGGAEPRAGTRIPPPVGVVLFDQGLGDQRLELPGAEVARRVEARVDVDEGVRGAIAEARGAR
jgi:hypothetical protein